jgi:hypothetical protein
MVLRAYNPTYFFINEITNEIIWRYWIIQYFLG